MTGASRRAQVLERARGLIPLLAILALLSCLGCARAPGVSIPVWSLTVEGRTYAVSLPKHFDDVLPRRDTTYTLAAAIPLPVELRGRPLTLTISHFPALCALEVGGEEMSPMDTSSSDEYRSDGLLRWRIPAAATHADTISAKLTVKHRWTQSGWLDAVPRLSATPRGDGWFLLAHHFNTGGSTVALGAAVLTFFAYALVFAFDRKRVAQGWFALEAFAASFYCLLQLGLTQPLFGVYDAPFAAFMLLVAVFSSVRFTHSQLRLEPPAGAWSLQLVVGGVVGVAAAGPFAMTRYFAPLVVALVATQVAYQVGVVARLQWRGQGSVNALFHLVSWAQLGVCGIPDFAAWLGFGEVLGGLRPACVGISIIALFQSAALSREYIISLSNADALNAELASRVALLQDRNGEVRMLNTELRRQISSRSEQLVLALARAGAPSAPRELCPGDTVDDRFEVVRRVGAGGMGTVFEVIRLADRRRLAIKVLTGASGKLDYARFAREAQLAIQVEHPSVVSVVDFHVSDDGSFFLVMEYVDGTSLRYERGRYGDVPWALHILEKVASGLAAVHALGIVHRDLKPANILLAQLETPDAWVVKIADFGISTAASAGAPLDGPASVSLATVPLPGPARSAPPPSTFSVSQGDALDDDDPLCTMTIAPATTGVSTDVPRTGESRVVTTDSLTQTGVLMGTPLYMPPEIAGSARQAQPSADMFSFGVIAYELLTGRVPFPDPLAAAKLAGRAVHAPAPLAEQCPDLDAGLASLLARCISEDPEARPTAAEVLARLRPLVGKDDPPAPRAAPTRSPAA